MNETYFQPIRSTQYPDLGSGTSSVWNFCTYSADVTLWGNHSVVVKCRLFSQVIPGAKTSIKRFSNNYGDDEYVRTLKGNS